MQHYHLYIGTHWNCIGTGPDDPAPKPLFQMGNLVGAEEFESPTSTMSRWWRDEPNHRPRLENPPRKFQRQGPEFAPQNHCILEPAESRCQSRHPTGETHE